MKLVETGVPAVNIVYPWTPHAFDVLLPQINPAAQSVLYDFVIDYGDAGIDVLAVIEILKAAFFVILFLVINQWMPISIGVYLRSQHGVFSL